MKYVLKHFESIQIKKNRPNFLTWSFSPYFGRFSRKTSPKKKSTRQQISHFGIFVLTYVSKHFEWIPKTKNFWPKIFHKKFFLVIFAKNTDFWSFSNFLGRNQNSLLRDFLRNLFTVILSHYLPCEDLICWWDTKNWNALNLVCHPIKISLVPPSLFVPVFRPFWQKMSPRKKITPE